MPPLAQKKPPPHRTIAEAHCGPVNSEGHWHTRGLSVSAPVLHWPPFRHCDGQVFRARVSFGGLGTRKGETFVRSYARVGPRAASPHGACQGFKKGTVRRVAEGGRTLCPARSPVQSTQAMVLFKSPSLQLEAKAEMNDTASSVASNVGRRIIAREDLRRRRVRARPKRRHRRSSHRSSVKSKGKRDRIERFFTS